MKIGLPTKTVIFVKNALGVPNRAEIIPFEPDAAHTAEGKSNGSTVTMPKVLDF